MRYNPFLDYDKYGCIKLPWTLYLLLAFLCRSYVMWLMSVANRKDSAILLNLFYPSRSDFSHALLFALPALLCAAVIFLRRAGMPKVIVASWHMIRGLLGLAAIVQIADVYMAGKITRYHVEHFSSYYTTFIELAMLLVVISYCMFNQRFKDVSAQYPQPLKEESDKQ